MSNVKFSMSEDGKVAYGELECGAVFIIDSDNLYKIKDVNFYLGGRSSIGKSYYVIDNKGKSLHDYLFEHRQGYEIDHISLNTFDNRRCNIRYCTHQQNQMNRSLQKNNTSGVCGVSFYKPRKKYRARIKIYQKDIHLGYYDIFDDAVKARNMGMLCMFGAYGRYTDRGEIPKWIENKVVKKCACFEELSKNSAFFDFWEGVDDSNE